VVSRHDTGEGALACARLIVKGGALLDTYTKDIREFVTEVQEEASKPLSQISEYIPIAVSLRGDNAQQPFKLQLTSLTTEDRLNELRSDPKTYTVELNSEDETVKKWLEEFNLDSKTEDISKLLEGENNKFAKLHSELGMKIVALY
jgi:Tfp pilus assembly protein PilP